MTESRQKRKPAKRRAKAQDEEKTPPSRVMLNEARKQQLKELDEFMETVLQKAGEEFLDEFKQVEGE